MPPLVAEPVPASLTVTLTGVSRPTVPEPDAEMVNTASPVGSTVSSLSALSASKEIGGAIVVGDGQRVCGVAERDLAIDVGRTEGHAEVDGFVPLHALIVVEGDVGYLARLCAKVAW